MPPIQITLPFPAHPLMLVALAVTAIVFLIRLIMRFTASLF